MTVSLGVHSQSQYLGNDFSADTKASDLSTFPQKTDTTFYNYPNPFTTSTQIHYSLDQHSFVQLKLFDRYGRYVKTLVSERQSPGSHKVVWNASKENGKEAPPGMYFAKLWSEDKVKLLKVYLAEK